MVNEDYVSFEIAKLLKERGFDEPCDTAYSLVGKTHKVEQRAISDWGKISQVKRPTLQMVMKWLREREWVICILPLTFYCREKVSSWGYNIWAGDNLEIDEEDTPKFTTYEEACEAAIKYCLEKLI